MAMDVGSQFRGIYRLEEEIHRGLSASVYRGSHLESGDQVAIKVFRERYQADPRFAIRFREHLRTLYRLSCQNLIAIRDYGLFEGRYYIVTEWVEGVDLGVYLSDHGTLSPWWAATVARQVCRALEAAHQAGLVHRGVKPQNILLTAQGQVKVTDVGMSGLVSETGLSRTNVMLEGIGYISPEQARAEPVGPASDVYSLGVTLFEMLTGRLPFVSTDVWTLVRLHATGVPPSPQALNPRLPADLAEVVRRSLEKTPGRRFASASEVEAALAVVQDTGSLSRMEAGAAGEPASQAGWGSFRGWRAGLQVLKRLLASRVPIGPPGWDLPFFVVLAFQFLVSFLLAWLVFYGLIILFG
jgi:serine/threonine-protein kinase